MMFGSSGMLVLFHFLALGTSHVTAAKTNEEEFRHPDLNVDAIISSPNDLPPQAKERILQDLVDLDAATGSVDIRSGRFATVLSANPITPGTGNELVWKNGDKPTDADTLGHAAWDAFSIFLEEHQQQLKVDLAELASSYKVTVHRDGEMVQISGPRTYNGLRVIGSRMTCTINHGNAVLFGTVNWGDIGISTSPTVTESEALSSVKHYVENNVEGYVIGSPQTWAESELAIVPMSHDRIRRGRRLNIFGRGLSHRLIWLVRVNLAGISDERRFEAMVDAESGAVLSFQDTNAYLSRRTVTGGVYPVSNDGVGMDGIEYAGWAMPFSNLETTSATEITDSGGNLQSPVSGDVTASLTGPYVKVVDECGIISLTTDAGIVDFGTSSGTDCTTPGVGGDGNTHAARTAYYHVSRAMEMARGQLPNNPWPQQQLIVNVNLSGGCNAYYGTSDGQLYFYQSKAGVCGNSGEIAGIILHEWGHAMDDNDATGSISGPLNGQNLGGDGFADVLAALRLGSSCVGRSFRQTRKCWENTEVRDTCTECFGYSDIDYEKYNSGVPHTLTWINANCDNYVRCKDNVYSEAIWSLWKRKLPAMGIDDITAHEIVTRLVYVAGGNVGDWYSPGSAPYGGCNADGGYLNFLAIDDDDGNPDNGTPHMTAIFEAFNDQEIACELPAVVDSGCTEVASMTAPTVSATGLDSSVQLSWTSVVGASKYEIFRTDGVLGCSSGKVRLGDTTSTAFLDSGLQNGIEYHYAVIPKGSADSCFGPASSCTSVTPIEAPSFEVDAESATYTMSTGDGDEFIDNGEVGTVFFTVYNTASGVIPLNMNIASVTVVSPTGSTITGNPTVNPSPVTASGTGSFDFVADGLSFGDDLVFEVAVVAAETTDQKTVRITFPNCQSNRPTGAPLTWTFDNDLEGWTVIDGTFEHDAGGFVKSSFQIEHRSCDQIRSPPFVLSAISEISIDTLYDIEGQSPVQWWDRANLAIISNNIRYTIDPDSGRLYQASGTNPSLCASASGPSQGGWADQNKSWATSFFSADIVDSLGFSGQEVQIDIAYNTDGVYVGDGFWFDSVTVTNVDCCELVPDTGMAPQNPTDSPTAVPTASPTVAPTSSPTEAPTSSPDTSIFVDFESGANGWSHNSGESSCTTGAFVVGSPEEMFSGGIRTQVNGDHTTGNGNAFFTANNLSVGNADIDGGVCVAYSPMYQVDEESMVSIWYFCGQRDTGDDPGGDFCRIQLSSDDGNTWENILEIGDKRNEASWTRAIAFSRAGSQVKIRVQASDGSGPGDIVEFGVDDLSIRACSTFVDFENGMAQWTNSAPPVSTCTTGAFVSDTPDAVTSGGVLTQVEGDHTTGTGNALFTARNDRGAGRDDVDNGVCVSESPIYNVPEDSVLSLYYFCGQRNAGDDQNDFCLIEFSTDGGISWSDLVRIGDIRVTAEWTLASVDVNAGDEVKLRLSASDGAGRADFIELGIDDIHICPR